MVKTTLYAFLIVKFSHLFIASSFSKPLPKISSAIAKNGAKNLS